MIDIIIPAYNAHNTIQQTLHSIALQTIRDKINIYIIDDCSDVDYTTEINLFKEKLNIKQLRMPNNSGPGAARQYGIDNSKGNFILFMDSDDLFIDCFSLNNLYKNIINSEYDLAVGIMVDETIDGYYDFDNHMGCLHAKMYKRSFLEKYNIRFNNTRNSEDDGFHKLVLLGNPNIIYVNEYIYLYRYNEKSITQRDSSNYKFYSMEWYIYNMEWAIKNAINRNFDNVKIARLICSSYMYVYNVYINNIYRHDLNLILIWSKPLHMLYKKYNILLTNEEKSQYYIANDSIIPISFREFMNNVELHNNIYM